MSDQMPDNPFNLHALETDVREGDFESAAMRALKLVETMDLVDLQMSTDREEETRKGFSRWSAVLAALVSDPRFFPSDDFYRGVVLRQRVLADLFASSDYGSTDAFLQTVVARLEETGDQSVSALRKLFLSYSLQSQFDLDVEAHLIDAPIDVRDACIGLLATDVVMTERAESLRRKISGLVPAMRGSELPFDLLRFLAQPWFLSSYDGWADKHDVKAHLNEMFRNTLSSVGIKEERPVERDRSSVRPTILLPLERFTSVHAMYRCWAPAIRQLRESFRLVAACDPKWMDELSRTVFDDVLDLRFGAEPLKRCVEQIRELKPDIVYYPSIGMSAEVIALANLRLAPIQVMTFGHPGASMIPVIDYAVMEVSQLGNPDLLNETVLLLRDGSCQMETRRDAELVKPRVSDFADPVRISVPSTYYKLNHKFLTTCSEICIRSTRNVEFHFFPSAIGPRFHHVRRRIHDVLPNAIVHPSTSYTEFVTNLNQCDIQLAAFPFGNANSNFDALRQGIPVITLEGGEVHSRIDGALLKVLGAPDWLVTRRKNEYVSTVLSLIEDNDLRVKVSREILECDLDRAHFDTHYEHTPKDFVSLFRWIYKHHEEVQADGSKVWNPEDRDGAIPDAVYEAEPTAASLS